MGLCHSDLHLIDGDWGDESRYPQVCGHEIVGTVVSLGSQVTRFEIGQRVGVGWQAASCLTCEWCLGGHEPLCQEMQSSCSNGQIGGFADYFVCDHSFVYDIPAALESSHAAPLLCAGHTVYSALAKAPMRAGANVAVLGIGGLGHLAIQFASKMGLCVTALSSGQSKRTDALAMGAREYLCTDDPDAMSRAAGTFDYILVTASAEQNWPVILALLRPLGELCFAGIPEKITLELANFVYQSQKITTVNIGSRKQMVEMLDLAAKFGIKPWVKKMPMAEINLAISKMRNNEAKYRIVLENTD